jgi:hypothetical protein
MALSTVRTVASTNGFLSWTYIINGFAIYMNPDGMGGLYLSIFNISNSLATTEVYAGTIFTPTGTHEFTNWYELNNRPGISEDGNYLFFIASTIIYAGVLPGFPDKMYTIDITDKSNPQIVGNYDLPDYTFTTNTGVLYYSKTATSVTFNKQNFSDVYTGQIVVVTGLEPADYNGTYTVASVAPTRFTCNKTIVPANTYAYGQYSGTVKRLLSSHTMTIRGNALYMRMPYYGNTALVTKYDISSPSSVAFVSDFTTTYYGVFNGAYIYGNYMIGSHPTISTTVRVYDITDIEAATIVSDTSISMDIFSYQLLTLVSADGNHVIITNGTTVTLYTFSDPTTLTLVGGVTLSSGIVTAAQKYGDYIVISTYTNAVKVYSWNGSSFTFVVQTSTINPDTSNAFYIEPSSDNVVILVTSNILTIDSINSGGLGLITWIPKITVI